jgi:hypothetical protein
VTIERSFKMSRFGKSCSCDDVELYRRRAEEAEERLREREESEEREQERRRREFRERRQEAMRSADSWTEAFQKQEALLRGELQFSERELEAVKRGEYPGDGNQLEWWTKDVEALRNQIAQLRRHARLYQEAMVALEAEYRERREHALKTLAAEVRPQDRSLADHLERDDYGGFLQW